MASAGGDEAANQRAHVPGAKRRWVDGGRHCSCVEDGWVDFGWMAVIGVAFGLSRGTRATSG
jgi:hypothetical protein